MAVARLSVVVIFGLLVIQDTIVAQQRGLNKPGEFVNIPSGTSKKVGLVSKKYNQNSDNGNSGSSTTQSNKSSGLTGLQQFLSLQKPAATPQQSLNINVQQIPAKQSLQQPLVNQNLPLSSQQQFQSLPLNLQNQILQLQQNQILQQEQQLHQQQQQQQQTPLSSVSNQQQSGKQSPTLRITGVSLAPLPMVNSQSSGTPSTVSQGVQLSSNRLPSNFPQPLQNSCNFNKGVDQIPIVLSQHNASPISSIPNSLVGRSQTPTNVPVSISTSSLPTDCSNMNIPSGFSSVMIPVSPNMVQNSILNQPAQSIEFTPITVSGEYQVPINQIISQSQSSDSEQLVEYQASPNQIMFMPAQSLDLPQITQTVEYQYQPVSNQVTHQPIHSQPTMQYQSQPLFSVQNQPTPAPIISNQMPNSQCSSSAYPTISPILVQSNQNPKSSNIKSLLPLLFDLLKEKNSGCGCPPCYNCGCLYNNNNMPYFARNNATQVPQPQLSIQKEGQGRPEPTSFYNQPQVYQGYSKLMKSGQGHEEPPMSNNIIPDEPKTPVFNHEEMKAKNKGIKNDNAEEVDDYNDSYEDDE